jgi:hypothetical protein
MNKQKISFSLSAEARRLLAEIARKKGISQSAVLELLIRAKAGQGASSNAAALQPAPVSEPDSTPGA